jgi:hypothetical protein
VICAPHAIGKLPDAKGVDVNRRVNALRSTVSTPEVEGAVVLLVAVDVINFAKGINAMDPLEYRPVEEDSSAVVTDVVVAVWSGLCSSQRSVESPMALGINASWVKAPRPKA